MLHFFKNKKKNKYIFYIIMISKIFFNFSKARIAVIGSGCGGINILGHLNKEK